MGGSGVRIALAMDDPQVRQLARSAAAALGLGCADLDATRPRGPSGRHARASPGAAILGVPGTNPGVGWTRIRGIGGKAGVTF